MTGRAAPALHLVVTLEEAVRPEIWAFCPADDARLLDELEQRRPQLLTEFEHALDAALRLMRSRVADYQPADLAPREQTA